MVRISAIVRNFKVGYARINKHVSTCMYICMSLHFSYLADVHLKLAVYFSRPNRTFCARQLSNALELLCIESKTRVYARVSYLF